jgi:hypothetical protein
MAHGDRGYLKIEAPAQGHEVLLFIGLSSGLERGASHGECPWREKNETHAQRIFKLGKGLRRRGRVGRDPFEKGESSTRKFCIE